MIVSVTNISDGPGRTPTQVDIYNKTLDPGASIKLPAELVDKKLRSLADRGLICIGSLPAWYSSAKMKRGARLSDAEMKKRASRTPPAPPAPVPKLTSLSSAKKNLKLLADHREEPEVDTKNNKG